MPDPLLLPHRIAGDLSLDLANTYSRRGTEREVDHLAEADAVLAWASAAGLIPDSTTLTKGEQARLVEEVHGLRHAVEEAGFAIAAGEPPPMNALTAIRDVAARSLARAKLYGLPIRLTFRGSDRIVGPIAWAALDLMRGDELDRLKRCPSDDCRWLFLDRTKNGSRRWCEMATCGDRAKKRANR